MIAPYDRPVPNRFLLNKGKACWYSIDESLSYPVFVYFEYFWFLIN
mgnify:CR=1 FL=1